MASDIWLRTILIVRKETRCRHMGYSFRLTARVHLYAPSHRQDSTYHGLCYTMKDRSDDPSHHERTLLPRSYISLLYHQRKSERGGGDSCVIKIFGVLNSERRSCESRWGGGGEGVRMGGLPAAPHIFKKNKKNEGHCGSDPLILYNCTNCTCSEYLNMGGE